MSQSKETPSMSQSQETPSMSQQTPSSSSTKYVSEEVKLKRVSDLLESLNWEPKSYIDHFLNATSDASIYKRRFWGCSSWTGTRRLLESIKRVVGKTDRGKLSWEDFILDEASMIICKQKPKTGYSPDGAYYSSKKLNRLFFTEEARLERAETIKESMPFLYNLLMRKLARPDTNDDSDDEEEKSDDGVDLAPLEESVPEPDEPHVPVLESDSDTLTELDPNAKIPIALSEDDVMEIEHNILRPSTDPKIRKHKQNEDMSRTICSMVTYGRNRRHNGFQLTNGLLFIACGVTERVNRYLNYIGITCCRRTAHLGLASLGKETEETLKTRSSDPNSKIFPPSICIDNLDFQQSIHTKSVGHMSTMFHGTWGYIHRLSSSFFNSLDHTELSLASLKQALKKSINLTVEPRHFASTFTSDEHFKSTLKSQLTSSFLRYIGSSSGKGPSLQDHPPPVRPIKADKPNLTMLKLMMASDNSSEGIGNVFKGLTEQTGLTPEQFSNQLQLVEGDLGTGMNILSLRELRIPASYSKTSLANLLAIPGAAHTMWNFSQSIFLHHWGDQTNRKDTGAWRVLKSLGIPADKPVTKMDFTLMISNMEKIHDADLIYCMLVVMGKECENLPTKLPTMSPLYIQGIVDQTYNRFLSGEAMETAVEKHQTKLINLLLRLRDFATVTEVNRASKAGNTGRLLFMWKQWAVMGQGLKKLVHYSRHLPQLILLIEVILPKSLAKVIENSLLLCPSGREAHFVATDFYLEVQNFWLKYFYNHSGIGTVIQRLRDVFSINIPILKDLMHTLNVQSGMNVIQQSHKNRITNLSINNFISFARQHNICSAEDKPDEFVPILISDIYEEGIATIKNNYANRKGGLDQLKPVYMFDPEIDNGDSDGTNKSNKSEDTNESEDTDESEDTNESEDTDESKDTDKSEDTGESEDTNESKDTDESEDTDDSNDSESA
ncbi:hypothetical protein PGTUg99_031052 [Puccinia graminis f. sp. tritici]|uniref:DUF6589 domain-containing protein n=2 Tax=Puccinia graminis f. sp. tritici TaxID=56615 RepID=A0A5B0N190_PUCGR|nr:hypothetical protein PGTUg99_031052 [Puccinia graminis f. sp. tritici]